MNDGFAARVPRWIALASQYLGWLPDTFWQATPGELADALADPQQAGERPLTRDEFEQLIKGDRNGRND